MTTFTNTEAALTAWAIRSNELAELWNQAENIDDIEFLEREERRIAIPVREAFYEDTKHVNSKNSCEMLDPRDIARVLAVPGGKTAVEYLAELAGAEG